MAAHYYGINLEAGASPSNVSTGTSTTSKTVEVVVTDAVTGTNKAAVIRALETIIAKITKSDAPA